MVLQSWDATSYFAGTHQALKWKILTDAAVIYLDARSRFYSQGVATFTDITFEGNYSSGFGVNNFRLTVNNVRHRNNVGLSVLANDLDPQRAVVTINCLLELRNNGSNVIPIDG